MKENSWKFFEKYGKINNNKLLRRKMTQKKLYNTKNNDEK